MRYELTDDEWTAIEPMLPRGVPRVNDRRVVVRRQRRQPGPLELPARGNLMSGGTSWQPHVKT